MSLSQRSVCDCNKRISYCIALYCISLSRLWYRPAWLGLRRGALTCVGWQVTLCDSIWQVTLRSSVVDLSIKSYTFLRATAVPEVLLRARISYGDSGRLSVRLSVTTRYGFKAR